MELISHEKLIGLVDYDPETGAFTRRKRVNQVLGEMGFVDRQGYRRIHLLSKVYRAHRLAWFYMTGTWPYGEIDHINGDRQDNRFANLRACTHIQNNHNQTVRRNNSSGVKGVYWSKSLRKWRGQVCLNYRIHHTPAFESIEDAAEAVRLLREQLHGEYANHG